VRTVQAREERREPVHRREPECEREVSHRETAGFGILRSLPGILTSRGGPSGCIRAADVRNMES